MGFFEKIKSGLSKTKQNMAASWNSMIADFSGENEEFFDELLQKGDLLHIVFGSGMTSSINGALGAAEVMQKKYPDRKLIVIDSTCSSSGYGMLVDGAADMRDAGKSMEEVEAWILDHRLRIHHQFFSTDLTYFRRGGRVSGVAATLATVLGICPLMHLNLDGFIIAYGKARGKMAAMKETLRVMETHAENGLDYSGKCWISHSHCIEEAEKMKKLILERFPNVKTVEIFDIGTIIAAHTGPGTVATFFFGDNRINDH